MSIIEWFKALDAVVDREMHAHQETLGEDAPQPYDKDADDLSFLLKESKKQASMLAEAMEDLRKDRQIQIDARVYCEQEIDFLKAGMSRIVHTLNVDGLGKESCDQIKQIVAASFAGRLNSPGF